MNPNILALRYATRGIKELFSEEGKVGLERDFWIAVLKSQKDCGVEIDGEEIAKYEAARDDINLDLIKEIELETRHDVKARIQAFVKAAGAKEIIHRPLTSRDDTDNVEQMQIKSALQIIRDKYVSVLRHMGDRASDYKHIELTARTHHQPAQPTLLGRRMTMWAEEMLCHLPDFEAFIDNYPLRGIKGPVGTQADILNLLGSRDKVKQFERKVAEHLGFSRILKSTGQVYPRSLDYKMSSHLVCLAAGMENFELGMRLMAGYELVTEGFKDGQVGSTAMPHKMNTRSSERIDGFGKILKGYNDMLSRASGGQWEEGDVSCSVLRRVSIPDSLYAADGMCETTLTVLNEMGPYPAIIISEVDRYFPFLATTQILSLATSKGMGREEAHKIIKQYAVAEALQMRNEGIPPALAEKLAGDPKFVEYGIERKDIGAVLANKTAMLGNARQQLESILEDITEYTEKHPQAAAYEPDDIL